MRIELIKDWIMDSNKFHNLKGDAPCTVLSILLKNKIIEDPYYRDNELTTRPLLDDDYTFTNHFHLTDEQLKQHNYLCLDGISTIVAIFVNEVRTADIFDFHTRKKYLLDNSVLKSDNTIKIVFKSSYQYVKEYPNPKDFFQTYAVTDKNSPVIRQPNYMFGWDWGPSLADLGIARPVYILSTKVGYLNHFERRFDFSDNNVKITITPHAELCSETNIQIHLKGFGFDQTLDAQNNEPVIFYVNNPELWYPNGLGKQSLYELSINLIGNDETVENNYKIGVRNIKIDDQKDKHGRNLALYVNNKKVFLKGSNYVPEDNILPFINKARTKKLLQLAASFNHNVVRVWGGGYYPSDDFYESCDELGLLVSQDLMFACAAYDIEDKHFKDLVVEETIDNLRRIGHHSCIFMINGNNEIEDGVRGHGHQQTANMDKMFLHIMKDIVEEETDLYYLPSSPTSGAPYFSSPNDPACLDTHYWWVWGADRPFEDYLSIKPRLLSEFGCESLPTYNTICKFTNEDERTIDSNIMKFHEKSAVHNNDKIVKYLGMHFKSNNDLKKMSYLSMMTQAEGIKLAVEHLRQNKELCNGAMYWQLNDSWPGNTFSSIDYYFGIKALHYYSKRFYASELVSFNHTKKGFINISNDTEYDKQYCVEVSAFDINGKILNTQTFKCSVDKFDDKDVAYEQKENAFGYVAQLYDEKHQLLSENYLLDKKDKDINYQKTHISFKKIAECELEVFSDIFVRGLYLSPKNNDVVLSDNFFNLLPGTNKTITTNRPVNINDFEVISLNNLY